MKDKEKTSFFKKIFGQKSSCCSLEIEEIDLDEGKVPTSKTNASNCCCCSPTDSDVKKNVNITGGFGAGCSGYAEEVGAPGGSVDAGGASHVRSGSRR